VRAGGEFAEAQRPSVRDGGAPVEPARAAVV